MFVAFRGFSFHSNFISHDLSLRVTWKCITKRNRLLFWLTLIVNWSNQSRCLHMRMWIVIEKMFTKVLFFSAYQVFRQTWLWWSGFRFEPILANTSATPKNTTYIKGGQKLLKNNHLTYFTKVQSDTLCIPWFSDTTLQVFCSKSIELLKIKKLNHICRCSMMTICHVGW